MQSFWSVAQGHRFKRAFARRGDPAVFHTFLFLASSPSSQKKSRHPPSPSAAPLFPLTDSHRIIARRHLPVLGPRILPWCHRRSSLASRWPDAARSFSTVHLLRQLRINGSHKAVAVGAAVRAGGHLRRQRTHAHRHCHFRATVAPR